MLFFGGPFEPLCAPHHDSDVHREEAEADASGLDGGR